MLLIKVRIQHWLGLLPLLVGLAASPAVAEPWKYVVPTADAPFEHPAFQAVPLLDTKPDRLQEKAAYRGQRRQYAQLTYGSPGSRMVAVVLDRLADEQIDLYLDKDRDRSIENEERLEGSGPTWRTALDAELLREGKPQAVPRTVILQPGRDGQSLRIATAGYVEGSVEVGGHSCPVRRTDGDANGLVADPHDRLWIDLDRNGQWDPIAEQFLLAPILVFHGMRYAVGSDELGQQLTFREIQGTGTAKIALPPDLASQVTEVAMTLVSRDGVVGLVSTVGTAATMPVGEYRVSDVTISLKDSSDGPAWNYIFFDRRRAEDRVWHQLERDGSLAIDPVGRPKLVASLGGKKGDCHAGDELDVRVQLYSGEGLLAGNMTRGGSAEKSRDRPLGKAVLLSAEGKQLDEDGLRFG